MLSQELITKIRQIEIHTKRLVNDSFAGEYHSVFKGRGMSFDEVRPYQYGDEIRTIDWNVTARTGEALCQTLRRRAGTDCDADGRCQCLRKLRLHRPLQA